MPSVSEIDNHKYKSGKKRVETPFNVVITFFMILAIGVMPFAISLRVCWVCSSWRRRLAVILTLVTGAIFLGEICGGLFFGFNLTGLIWMLSFPFVSIAVVALYVIEKFSRSLKRSEIHGASPSSDEPIPNNGMDAKGSVSRV